MTIYAYLFLILALVIGLPTHELDLDKVTPNPVPLSQTPIISPSPISEPSDKICPCPPLKGVGFEFAIDDRGFIIKVSHGGHALFGYISLFGLIAIWSIIQMVVIDLITGVWQEIGV